MFDALKEIEIVGRTSFEIVQKTVLAGIPVVGADPHRQVSRWNSPGRSASR
jgi:hypothetical protein